MEKIYKASFRALTGPVLIFNLLVIVLFILLTIRQWERINSGARFDADELLTAGILIIFAETLILMFVLFIASFRVRIGNDKVSFSWLGLFRRDYAFADLKSVNVKAQTDRNSSLRLILTTRAGHIKVFPLRAFKPEDVHKIVEELKHIENTRN
ncbi:MAG: hypothetical protein JXR78_08660 [Victivallales bacterium]|nr:hypothetical protein [Victivallales bacterium]